MLKKLLVFTSIVVLMLTLMSVLASAEILNFSIDKANDTRYSYVQEYPELCNYMYCTYIKSTKTYNPETGEYVNSPIYFSTKQTSLCVYPVPGKDGVYMSKMISNPAVEQSSTLSNAMGHATSLDYAQMIESHSGVNKKLIEVFGENSTIRYLLDDEYSFSHQKDGFWTKARIDIGSKTVTVYLNMQPSKEQSDALMHDDTMNMSTVYILGILIVVVVVVIIAVFVYMKMKKEIYKKASYY